MRFTRGDSDTEPEEDEDYVWDLMYGIGPWHIQQICIGEMGMGYLPRQVGEMTLDEFFMVWADKKILRKSRKSRSEVGGVPAVAEDGLFKGRAKDGTPIKGKMGGKSLARQLMEEEERKRLKVEEAGWEIRSRERAERRERRKN